jgi:hypothetical protein
MDRMEQLLRKHRPALFAHCEICEKSVKIMGHEHDPEKAKAYCERFFPEPKSIEQRLNDVLDTFVGQNINSCRDRLVVTLMEEVDHIIADSHPVG